MNKGKLKGVKVTLEIEEISFEDIRHEFEPFSPSDLDGSDFKYLNPVEKDMLIEGLDLVLSTGDIQEVGTNLRKELITKLKGE